MSTRIIIADVGLRVRSASIIPPKNKKDNKVYLLVFGQEVSLLFKKGKRFKLRYKSADDKNKPPWQLQVIVGLCKLKSINI